MKIIFYIACCLFFNGCVDSIFQPQMRRARIDAEKKILAKCEREGVYTKYCKNLQKSIPISEKNYGFTSTEPKIS